MDRRSGLPLQQYPGPLLLLLLLVATNYPQPTESSHHRRNPDWIHGLNKSHPCYAATHPKMWKYLGFNESNPPSHGWQCPKNERVYDGDDTHEFLKQCHPPGKSKTCKFNIDDYVLLKRLRRAQGIVGGYLTWYNERPFAPLHIALWTYMFICGFILVVTGHWKISNLFGQSTEDEERDNSYGIRATLWRHMRFELTETNINDMPELERRMKLVKLKRFYGRKWDKEKEKYWTERIRRRNIIYESFGKRRNIKFNYKKAVRALRLKAKNDIGALTLMNSFRQKYRWTHNRAALETDGVGGYALVNRDCATSSSHGTDDIY